MYRHRFLALLRHSSQYWKAAAVSRGISGIPLRKLGTGSIVGVLFYTAAAKSITETQDKQDNFYKNTALRRQFRSYASLCYNDEPFMTGEDFVKAVSGIEQRNEDPDSVMRNLSEEEYQNVLSKALLLDLDSEYFLGISDYIISYSEFLFLLSALDKPIDQFYRHFRILDRANSNTLSKDEFLSMENLMSGGRGLDHCVNATTSMQIILFGSDQEQEVDFEKFSKFLHCVQRQCLKAEFEAYSDGMDFITDDEFMRLLLRRTCIPDTKKARYIDRLEARPEETRHKIVFSQFSQFMNLLNDFPDFEVAIRMYAITKKALTKKDFQRAVKASTGSEFDEELVDVIFDVFDEDHDNKLGHDEFIEVMKDSIKSRNALSSNALHVPNATTREKIMNCVRQNMYRGYAN